MIQQMIPSINYYKIQNVSILLYLRNKSSSHAPFQLNKKTQKKEANFETLRKAPVC